ncbi:MAG: MotA/TolQ/ExbB proton channel family protein [Candidatus Auribacterota bacterium]|jgi:biopolymer transport protein ExbB|nr:MotA/TolQ/ExbB proton channel family protein [Candidatus Auribacterota bacterium]
MDALHTLIQKGGYIMYPILFCSLLSLTVILERLFSLTRFRVAPAKLRNMIQNYSSSDSDSLIAYCDKHKNPMASVIRKLINNAHLSSDQTAELIKVTGRQETSGLDRGLFLLELIASITPLMGLLGTVLGMIEVFDTIAMQGVGQAGALSAGISKALITTVAGLSVAIPTLAAYTLLSRKAERLTDEIDRHTTVLFGKIYGIQTD